MSDQGKSNAISELRREVGFGCPKCRSPFLTWHHFDPPVHEAGMHWNVDGIVALCPLCHADADEKGDSAGAYSMEEMRALKKSKQSAEEVKGRFPTWEDKKRLLVRLGGVYADTNSPLFSINEIPQIIVGKNEAGLLCLSFELRNSQDQVILRMDENWLTAYPANVHDMIVTPKTKEVKIWLDKENIGLELSFKRITMAELDQLLTRDRERIEKVASTRVQESFAQMPPEHRKFFEQTLQDLQSQPRQLPPGVDDLPVDLRAAILSDDQVGTFVKCWAEQNCAMDDGLIPFLDFNQLAIYHHGVKLLIKDGVAGFLLYSAAFDNQREAINIGCPCSECSSRVTA